MTLVVVPFCAMLAPCSMLSRTPRAALKERGAGSKIPLDNPSPIQGFELANVESRRLPSHGARPEPSDKRVNSRHARIPVRPQRVVKMTFASSNPLTPATESGLVLVFLWLDASETASPPVRLVCAENLVRFDLTT